MISRRIILLAAGAATLVAIIFSLYEVFSFSGSIGGPLSENLFFLSDTVSYPAFAEVSSPKDASPMLGFALDGTSINFGAVPSGGNYVTKFIDLANEGKSRVLFVFRADGSVKNMVNFEKNEFVLPPGEKESVPVKFVTKEGTELGKYDGTIYISRVLAKNPFASILLGAF